MRLAEIDPWTVGMLAGLPAARFCPTAARARRLSGRLRRVPKLCPHGGRGPL